jgi:hypothetical protein
MNTSSAPTFQAESDSISFISDFEISGSPEFIKQAFAIFGNDAIYFKTPSNNSKNRAKRARKKSKK